MRRVNDRMIGEFDIPGMPVKFSQWAVGTNLSAALLGEHNDQVLRNVLSVPDFEIAALYSEKVLVRDQLLDTDTPKSRDEHGPRAPCRTATDVAK